VRAVQAHGRGITTHECRALRGGAPEHVALCATASVAIYACCHVPLPRFFHPDRHRFTVRSEMRVQRTRARASYASLRHNARTFMMTFRPATVTRERARGDAARRRLDTIAGPIRYPDALRQPPYECFICPPCPALLAFAAGMSHAPQCGAHSSALTAYASARCAARSSVCGACAARSVAFRVFSVRASLWRLPYGSAEEDVVCRRHSSHRFCRIRRPSASFPLTSRR